MDRKEEAKQERKTEAQKYRQSCCHYSVGVRLHSAALAPDCIINAMAICGREARERTDTRDRRNSCERKKGQGPLNAVLEHTLPRERIVRLEYSQVGVKNVSVLPGLLQVGSSKHVTRCGGLPHLWG
jgi:hypothetical protein